MRPPWVRAQVLDRDQPDSTCIQRRLGSALHANRLGAGGRADRLDRIRSFAPRTSTRRPHAHQDGQTDHRDQRQTGDFDGSHRRHESFRWRRQDHQPDARPLDRRRRKQHRQPRRNVTHGSHKPCRSDTNTYSSDHTGCDAQMTVSTRAEQRATKVRSTGRSTGARMPRRSSVKTRLPRDSRTSAPSRTSRALNA